MRKTALKNQKNKQTDREKKIERLNEKIKTAESYIRNIMAASK